MKKGPEGWSPKPRERTPARNGKGRKEATQGRNEKRSVGMAKGRDGQDQEQAPKCSDRQSFAAEGLRQGEQTLKLRERTQAQTALDPGLVQRIPLGRGFSRQEGCQQARGQVPAQMPRLMRSSWSAETHQHRTRRQPTSQPRAAQSFSRRWQSPGS